MIARNDSLVSGGQDHSAPTVFNILRELIIKGEMAPSSKISEPELAMRLGIGRSRVREAMLRLEQEGFVIRSQSGRVSVAPLEVSELEQLYWISF
jgi:DNA-binding GntR family transcriptional regulator